MAKDADKITLGTGDLFLDGIEVGYLKGPVEFTYTREKVDFKASNELSPVKTFVVGEEATLKASAAELSLKNIKLALGVTQAINASQSFPSYGGINGNDSCSYDAASGTSWDIMKFGGSKCLDEMCLRFEHTRPDGNLVIIVLYKVTSVSDFLLQFQEEDIVVYDMEFRALAVASRDVGDRLGFIAEQVQGATDPCA